MNQPVKTAILSFGMSGKVFHAPFIHVLPEFELYGVWERSKNEAEKIYQNIKTFRTLEEVLTDNEVELVIVNTPNTTHFEYARKALMAGKHVIVEKPFVVEPEEGQQLIDLAREKNRCLSVYHNRRFDSDFKIVRKVVQEKLLGKIVEAEFHFDRFKETLSPKTHKEKPEAGTGALYDLGSHLIDQALVLFGMPEKLFADIRIIRPASLVDDYFELILYYPELRVRLHCSYIVLEPVPAYQVHGYKGSFIKSKSDIQENALIEGKSPSSEDWGKEPENEKGLLHVLESNQKKLIPSENGNYSDYFREFYKAIRNSEPLPVQAEEALNVIKVIKAAFRSAFTGQIVKL